MLRKTLIAVTAVITTNVATAAWIDLGNFDSPTLANSVIASCDHRVVNKANDPLIGYIYPEVFEQISLFDTYLFYVSPSASSMQQMLKFVTSPQSTSPSAKIRNVLDIMHDQYPDSKIKDLSLVFRFEQGVSSMGESKNEIYVEYSLYDYHGSASGATVIKSFDFKVDPVNKKYFVLQQSCD